MTEWYADEGFWARISPFLFSKESFERAEDEVAQLIALTSIERGTALDLCCGPGRHAVPLAKQGFAVTGVDLTPNLLEQAKQRADAAKVAVEWVEQDMREFVRPGAFDLILNLFTSFGYFQTEAEEMKTLKNMVESLTDEIDEAAMALIERVDELGGAVAAIEEGFQKSEIENSAYRVAQEIDAGDRVVVGVNEYTIDGDEHYDPLQVDMSIEADQVARLAALKADRDNDEVERLLGVIRDVAAGDENLLYPMRDALRARATVGEVSDALRDVWGTYQPKDAF